MCRPTACEERCLTALQPHATMCHTRGASGTVLCYQQRTTECKHTQHMGAAAPRCATSSVPLSASTHSTPEPAAPCCATSSVPPCARHTAHGGQRHRVRPPAAHHPVPHRLNMGASGTVLCPNGVLPGCASAKLRRLDATASRCMRINALAKYFGL
jgi:hypothetical protein